MWRKPAAISLLSRLGEEDFVELSGCVIGVFDGMPDSTRVREDLVVITSGVGLMTSQSARKLPISYLVAEEVNLIKALVLDMRQ